MIQEDGKRQWWRYPLMIVAMLALGAGLWGGLFRLGWLAVALRPTLPMSHGPLMVCGFLGTLISMERAVALGRTWSFAAPAFSGLGGLLLIAGIGSWHGPLLITAGSLMLLAIFGVVLRIQAHTFVVVMMLGALAWFTGNVLWLLGAPVFEIVQWWMGFLVLTIAGERLELSRMLLHAPRVQWLFVGIAAVLGVGLMTSSFAHATGMRVTGLALIGLALWLFYYDIARHTIRQTGLTRFIAACLLAGYVWLGIGGVLALLYGGATAGPLYDAFLHAVFVGFVFSMIFGHAPIILPSVSGTPLAYRSFFYVHLTLLHVSLVLRMVGDLGGSLHLRQCGGVLNAAAILLFLSSTIVAVRSAQRSKPSLIPDASAAEHASR